MTLVLTLLTSDYAVQASDRRLVAPDGSVFEDEENKGIFWQGVASLSYTGLARIGRKPTAEHCLDVMAEVSPGKLLIEFPAQMTRDFRTLPKPRSVGAADWRRIKRTTFVIAGFAPLSGTDAPPSPHLWSPWAAVISNAQLPDGSWRSEAATTFSITMEYLSAAQPFTLRASGQPLFATERIQLTRNLGRGLARGFGPEPAARLLARCIRAVAERNTAVGRSVMCTIVTRPDDDTRRIDVAWSGRGFPRDGSINEQAIFRPPEPDRAKVPRYIYWPGDPSHRTHYGPGYVGGEFVIAGVRMV